MNKRSEEWRREKLNRIKNAKTNSELNEVLLEDGVISCKTLKDLFPQHKEEIEKLSMEMACGCSACVLGVLRSKYGLELPEKHRYSIAV